MTATHGCRECGKETTHVVGSVEIDGEKLTALRCVVCGAVVLVEVHDG